MLYSLFLLPVNVVAKLGMETFDIKAKHAVHAQLAQLSGISGSQSRFFVVGQIVFRHYGLEIREGSFNTRLVHFEVKEQTAQMIATHNCLPSLQVAENSDYRLLKKISEARRAKNRSFDLAQDRLPRNGGEG
jgi:hypothetical protein